MWVRRILLVPYVKTKSRDPRYREGLFVSVATIWWHVLTNVSLYGGDDFPLHLHAKMKLIRSFHRDNLIRRKMWSLQNNIPTDDYYRTPTE